MADGRGGFPSFMCESIWHKQHVRNCCKGSVALVRLGDYNSFGGFPLLPGGLDMQCLWGSSRGRLMWGFPRGGVRDSSCHVRSPWFG
jgi:hypothetical protein